MRILTVGAKKSLSNAMEEIAGVELWRLDEGCNPEDVEEGSRRIPYYKGSKLNFRSVWQVRDAIQRVKPDVVHAFYPRAIAHTTLAVTGMRSRPLIAAYRGITSKVSRTMPEEWITHLSPMIDRYTCESTAVKQSLVDAGAPDHKCHVVYNCLTHFPTSPGGREGLSRWGIGDQDFVVMMVANLRWVKAPDLMLQAALMCSDLPRLRVVMVGRHCDPKLLKLANDPRLADRVVLTGPQKKAVNLMAGADLFVMPSRAEALSVAVLEAMSEGVCPIVSDAGGLKEAVRHERDGLVFPSGDASGLAAALRRLYCDHETRRRFAASARQRVREVFSPTAFARRLVGVCQSQRAAA